MNAIISNALVNFESLNVELGDAVWPLLQPPAKAALARAIRDRGVPLFVTSAYRTIAQQQILYNHYKNNRCGITLAAPPPRSNHQSGLAIDVPVSEVEAWKPYLEKHGWRWLGPADRVHFDYVGSGTKDLRSVAVKAFQQLWNRNNYNDQIAEDGIWGISTLRRLQRSPVKGFGKSIYNYRILRLTQPFMQGKDVRQVQEALAERGFDLEVDGIYGPSTQTTIRQFQKKNDLTVDGMAGPETISALGLYC
jgi:peptidoglycan hydrolase-like protein with peptidoglycan-binding domain